MKAVVLAAGYGSRLLPLTSFRPKSMLPVAGKPILHHSLEYLRDLCDIKEVIIVVGYQRNAIMDYFKNGQELGIDISYVVQRFDQTRGLAAAVNLVADKINDDFVLLLGDNLFSANLKKVIDLHFSSESSGTLQIEENPDPSRYGVVELDGDDVLSVTEKPPQPKSNYVITGFYVFSPVIFTTFSGLKPSARGEYEISDSIQALIDKKYRVKACLMEGWRHDIGYPEDLLLVNQHYLDDTTHRVNGEVKNSTINPPVYIGENCLVEDSVVGPYVMIEDGVQVVDTEIKNSVILEKSVVKRCLISDSVIGTNSQIQGLKAHSLKVGDYSDISNGTI